MVETTTRRQPTSGTRPRARTRGRRRAARGGDHQTHRLDGSLGPGARRRGARPLPGDPGRERRTVASRRTAWCGSEASKDSPAVSTRHATAIARARAIMDDLGLRHLKAHSTDVAVLVEMLAGDFEAAEHEARDAYACSRRWAIAPIRRPRPPCRRGARGPGAGRRGRGVAGDCKQLGRDLEDPDDLDVEALIAARAGSSTSGGAPRTSLAQGGEVPVPPDGSPLHARRDPRADGPKRRGARGCGGMPAAVRVEGDRPARDEGEGACRADAGARGRLIEPAGDVLPHLAGMLSPR